MGQKISTEEAAIRMGLRPGTLRSWRCSKKGPSFIRYSEKSVVYDEDDIQRYIEEHRVKLFTDH